MNNRSQSPVDKGGGGSELGPCIPCAALSSSLPPCADGVTVPPHAEGVSAEHVLLGLREEQCIPRLWDRLGLSRVVGDALLASYLLSFRVGGMVR